MDPPSTEMSATPPIELTPATKSSPTIESSPAPLFGPTALAPTPEVVPPSEPELLVLANEELLAELPKNETQQDIPVVEEPALSIVPAPQVSFIRLATNEVQLELNDCSDYSLVLVAPGHLIVESTTAEGDRICFLINAQLIPGLKDRKLNLKDKIQIGDFDFVIVARG